MTENEKWYDEEIGPKLLEIGRQCEERGVAFVAVVEYDHGERGKTQALPPGAGLEMVMLSHCAKMGRNIDGYIIGLKRYAHENNIDVSASIYLSNPER